MTRWPWPEDTPLERARRIANSLLNLLPADERPIWTARAHELGETWLGETLLRWTADDAINGAEAAELAHVSEHVIRKWATMRHPDRPDRPLLPRFSMRGRQRTYLVGDVIDAMSAIRTARAKRQVRRLDADGCDPSQFASGGTMPTTPLGRPDDGFTDEWLTNLAALYRQSVEDSVRNRLKAAPARAIAEHFGVPVRTVHRWIAEARKRGHLPKRIQGRVDWL